MKEDCRPVSVSVHIAPALASWVDQQVAVRRATNPYRRASRASIIREALEALRERSNARVEVRS